METSVGVGFSFVQRIKGVSVFHQNFNKAEQGSLEAWILVTLNCRTENEEWEAK